MYQLLLISHYLRRRMIPLFAALAVTLCTAMVIIVMSVMGGFLDLMRGSAHKLTGDVVIGNVEINRPTGGFAHYRELTEELGKDPAVARATPVIECLAMLNMPGKSGFYQVVGVEGGSIGDVLKFEPMWKSEDIANQMGDPESRSLWSSFDLQKAGKSLSLPASLIGDRTPGKTIPAAMLGVEVNPRHYRDEHGQYSPSNAYVGGTIELTLVPLGDRGQSGAYEPKKRALPVVNELKSGFYEYDKSRIYVPFDWLQQQLEMSERETAAEFDPVTGQGGAPKIKPARCTQVLIAGRPGVPLDEVRMAAERAVQRICDRHPDCNLDAYADVTPWDRIPFIRGLLNAVKSEKGMMTFLFAVIGMVAVMMVGITFYMIVLEKTRDIGILRSIGASQYGILSLFVRYGLVIGVIGSALGVGLAWFVVTHLNNLEHLLGYNIVTGILCNALLAATVVGATVAAFMSGRRAGTGFERGLGAFLFTLLAGSILLFFSFTAIGGLRPEWLMQLDMRYAAPIWDPRYYYFDKVPDTVNWLEARWVAVFAVVASVMGALVPAVLAASKNPVEAMRHE